MARIRTIKPDFFLDAELCDLSPLHRLLFAALWCHADRDGRLEDKPKELKVKCLPFDDCRADELLADLHRAGFITRYEVGGKRLIAIKDFDVHQRFHRDEKSRKLPAPPQHRADTVLTPPSQPVDTTDTPLEHECHAATARVAQIQVVSTSDTSSQDVRPSDPVRSAGSMAAPASFLAGAVPGRRVEDHPPPVSAGETLRDAMERLWGEHRGKPPTWGHEFDAKVRPAFDRCGGDSAELLRVFAVGLQRTYPKLVKLSDLSANWDDYAATKTPEHRAKSGPNARATDADKVQPGYEPRLTADGDLDLGSAA